MEDVITSVSEEELEQELAEKLAPLLGWRREEEANSGDLSRNSPTLQKIGDWKYFSLGAHGIVYVDDKSGLACKLLYDKNNDKLVKDRYGKL